MDEREGSVSSLLSSSSPKVCATCVAFSLLSLTVYQEYLIFAYYIEKSLRSSMTNVENATASTLGSPTEPGTSQNRQSLLDRLSDGNNQVDIQTEGIPTGIRPYVQKIDAIIQSFRDGERSKYEGVAAIIRLLEEDSTLSDEERTQSFELLSSEINSIQASPNRIGKRRAEDEPPTARD